MMLEGKGIRKSFGGRLALQNIDFDIEEKGIVGLIGPNGAGKTTLFNVITGVYAADSGTIKFCDHDITNAKTHKICKLGVARVFQIARPFLNMTALDNVAVSIMANAKDLTVDKAKKEAERYLESVNFPLDKKNTVSKNLPLFERKAVELARALATKPKLLLIDEYVAGLNATEVIWSNKLIRSIRDDLGVTIFWIEHVMKAVMEVSDRIMVLHNGQKISEGTPKEVANDERVIKAYLGERYAHNK